MLVHHRINIWSSSTTEHKNIARSFPQRKIELTVQPFILENLKMEGDSAKNLVKGSAEQTGKELPRARMKQKFNERYCIQSNNELVIESSLRLANYYRKGNIDDSSRNQLQVQESESSSKCSKLFHGNCMDYFSYIKCLHLYMPP